MERDCDPWVVKLVKLSQVIDAWNEIVMSRGARAEVPGKLLRHGALCRAPLHAGAKRVPCSSPAKGIVVAQLRRESTGANTGENNAEGRE